MQESNHLTETCDRDKFTYNLLESPARMTLSKECWGHRVAARDELSGPAEFYAGRRYCSLVKTRSW